MPIFLEYGVSPYNELVHIEQVTSGRTDLTCPYCGVQLIARKGEIKIHHFAHNGNTCREVAERDENTVRLPYYDSFDLGLSATDIAAIRYIANLIEGTRVSRYDLEELERRGFAIYNDWARDWQLTHKGGIPVGQTTLQQFAAIQYEHLIKRHEALAERVQETWQGIPHSENDIRYLQRRAKEFDYEFTDEDRYIQPPQPEQLPSALTDLNIYRAQLRRVFTAQLYFLEVKYTGGVLYKVGVTSRHIEERIVEIERAVHPFIGKVTVKPIRLLAHRGSIEFYFKLRYREYRHTLANFTEYLALDNRRNVLSDLTRLGDYDPDEFIQSIIDGQPSEIEQAIEAEAVAQQEQAQREKHRLATVEGMNKAKEQGIHVGRPFGTTETEDDLLRKYPLVVEAIEKAMSLRQAADYAGVSVNTVRKVKNLIEQA